MTTLLPEQIEALRQLQGVCEPLGVDVVLIGAVAYRYWLTDDNRTTEDVDVAIALDLDEAATIETQLAGLGWTRDLHKEQRWHAASGARIDVLPVGERARRQKQLQWPRSEMVMNLVGFRHVFATAVRSQVAPDLTANMVTPQVLGLLKIAAYLDRPELRRKDLEDLTILLHEFECQGNRRFDDDVIEAGVDYDEAGAFLLGQDLRLLCSDDDDEVSLVERFLRRAEDSNSGLLERMAVVREFVDPNAHEGASRRIAAFAKGFREVG